MNENIERKRPLKLSEEFGRSRNSAAWEQWEEHPPLIRIWTNGDCWCVPFSEISAHYVSTSKALIIKWSDEGEFIVKGPKVLQFMEQLCEHAASNLKTDGKDIVSVTFEPAEHV
jgi:glycine cleavage system aminomethyltransferase T